MINLDAFKAAYAKAQEAMARLNNLVSAGAIQKDIDDQKAVVTEVLTQFNEVAGIVPMPK